MKDSFKRRISWYEYFSGKTLEKRKLKKISQSALAERIGVSKSYISKIENNYNDISIDYEVVVRICNYLDINIYRLNQKILEE